MPIYEFKCEVCSHIDEILMKISDPAPEKCSVCGAKVNKIMSKSSFSLKGTGWYATDYTSKPVETKTEQTSTTSAVSSTPEAETKPAEKKMDPAASPVGSPRDDN